MEIVPSTKLMLLNLERIDKYIHLANIKASLVLPANAILLGFLLDNKETYLKILEDTSLSWFTLISYVAVLFSIVISILFSIFVVIAYLKSDSKSGDYYSLLYFGSIGEMELNTFLKKISEITEESFIDDLGRQIYLLSKELKKKFCRVNWSLSFLSFSFILSIVTIILGVIL